MKYKYVTLSAIVALAALLYSPSIGLAESILGTADSFAVLGGSAVTNTGSSTITGNLGVYPEALSTITGFPPGIVSGGTIHGPDAVSQQAQSDVTAAYIGLAAMPATQNLTGTDLGGLTLTSGVYHFDTTAQLTGTLTLNAEGNDNAFWVFQMGSTLTTASSSVVQVINGSPLNGVFWQVGSSATLGSSTAFEGNILALTSISMNDSATIVCGRALARNGAVTLISNVIGGDCANGYNGGLMFDQTGTIVPIGGGQPSVPEPGTLLLLGSGLVSLAFYVRRRKE